MRNRNITDTIDVIFVDISFSKSSKKQEARYWGSHLSIILMLREIFETPTTTDKYEFMTIN